MKKITFVLLLSLFAFIACQTDSVNTETEAFELKRNSSSLNIGVFNPIPEKFTENPEAYIAENLEVTPKDNGVQYGCVTFINGLAIIENGCTITSGIPRDFLDCDLKGVRVVICGMNPFNTLCSICAVAYILECDGQLGWVIGYNIICDTNPQPL